MQLDVKHGDPAYITFKRSKKVDPSFDAVLLKFYPEENHPEDYNTLKVAWEHFSKG